MLCMRYDIDCLFRFIITNLEIFGIMYGNVCYFVQEWSIPWYGDKTYEEERKKNGPHGAIIRVKQLKIDY